MKLIGLSITPSFNLTDRRTVEELADSFPGVELGPVNTSNNRSRVQVAITDDSAGFDFLLALQDIGVTLTLIPALEVHR